MRILAGAAAGGYYEAFGGHLVPQVFGGWSTELLSTSNRIDASFAGVANSTFSMSGPGEDRSKMIGSGSLAYMGSNWTVGLSYDADIASKTHVQTARLTVAGKF
jgi:hypothetical protein